MKNRDGMPLLIQLIHGMLDRDNMPFSLAGPHSTPQLRCRRPCPPESTLHLKGLDTGFRMQQLNAATKRIDYRIGAFDAARPRAARRIAPRALKGSRSTTTQRSLAALFRQARIGLRGTGPA